MKHDGESGQLLHDFVEHIESQWRRNQTTSLGVAGTLLGLELVSTVAGTDRDSQRVNACLLGEVDYFLRFGIVRYLSGHLVFNTGKHTKLTFNCYIKLMGVVNNFLGQGNILLIRKR